MNSDWYQAYWYTPNGNRMEDGSYTFIRVKDFRQYWHDHGSYYKQVTGKAALTNKYSPAASGDAYIFDSGYSRRQADWEHATISVGWADGHDEYAQHSPGKTADWRTWYWKHTASQRLNMERPGHGVLVIRP
jgi:hypothetical protein